MMEQMTDKILPFDLEKIPVRGRLVRLDKVVSEILNRHSYPPIVNYYVSETIALSAALVSVFKFDGIFTLQVSGSGPLRLVVVDVTSNGDIRACAKFDPEDLKKQEDKSYSVQTIIGAGSLTFTIDQNDSEERYQGTVELTGTTLAECLHHFFRQSEQLATGIITAISSDPHATEQFSVAALMVQKIPSMLSQSFEELEKDNDNWLKTLSILGTTTSKELLDKNLPSTELLYRLFWEDGVRVFDPKKLTAKCRCSSESVEGMLKTFSKNDLRDMVLDHKIIVTCEFCSTTYDFKEDEFFAEN